MISTGEPGSLHMAGLWRWWAGGRGWWMCSDLTGYDNSVPRQGTRLALNQRGHIIFDYWSWTNNNWSVWWKDPVGRSHDEFIVASGGFGTLDWFEVLSWPVVLLKVRRTSDSTATWSPTGRGDIAFESPSNLENSWLNILRPSIFGCCWLSFCPLLYIFKYMNILTLLLNYSCN